MNNDIRFPEIKPLKIERYAKIVSTGVGLPERVVTNQDIIDEYDIIATDRAVRYSVGIVERRWVTDEKLEDLVAMAISQCLERAGLDIDSVDRINIFALLGDYQVPATSIGALRKLGAKLGYRLLI